MAFSTIYSAIKNTLFTVAKDKTNHRFYTRAGARSANLGMRGVEWGARKSFSTAAGFRDTILGKAPGILGLATQKKFIIPALALSAVVGGAQGYYGELLKDPYGQAWITSEMQRRTYDKESAKYNTYPRELGTPLGYLQYGKYNNYSDQASVYPTWRLPTGSPLNATGQLALAAFATRHGR